MLTNTQVQDDYEKLFYMSLDMLFVAGTDGFFKKINPTFSKILGYTDEELLSTPFIELIHENDREATLLEVERLKDGYSTIAFENRYRTINGDYRIFSWTTNVDTSSGLLFGVARDVTDERLIKNKLEQIESALDKKTILAYTDIHGTIMDVNQNFCNISGYSREELIGQNHRIIKSGRHSQAFYKEMWDTISSGKIWSGMLENRRKNGDHYFVFTIITPLFDVQGNIQQYLAIRFDTTKHIQVKNELNKTLEILNETGAIAKVGGWELDVATGELTWTDETFKILEVEKKADQKPILPEGLELFVDEHKPIIERAVQRAMEYGEPYSLELKANTAKGNVLWVYTNGKANYVDGKIVSLSGTIQDIDTKKITELKYEAERLKSIQNAKLASLGELAAGIAHEINNPLSIISGVAQIMPKFFDNPDKLNMNLEDISKSCNRISRIVQSLKKYSRTSDQREKVALKLKDIVAEAIVLTSAKLKRYSTSLKTNFQSDSMILCDEVEIEQVVVNLINNAVDEIKDLDEKWIRLELYDQGENVVLTITDSGPGIPDAVKEKLFDPFFTTKRTGEGTGLGLSITKGILDEHNATISLDEKNPNTCFQIIFNKIEG